VSQATLFGSRLELAFLEFDRANPEVWRLFVRFTFQVIRSGRRHYGAKAVFERIRWHVALETTEVDFKLNNNFTAYYARKFHEEYPEHAGFFHTRG